MQRELALRRHLTVPARRNRRFQTAAAGFFLFLSFFVFIEIYVEIFVRFRVFIFNDNSSAPRAGSYRWGCN